MNNIFAELRKYGVEMRSWDSDDTLKIEFYKDGRRKLIYYNKSKVIDSGIELEDRLLRDLREFVIGRIV